MGRVTWKRISEKKLPVERRSSPVKADVCPICGKPLVEMEYVGKDKSILKILASGCEGDYLVDAEKDGKVVWRKVRKRKRSAS